MVTSRFNLINPLASRSSGGRCLNGGLNRRANSLRLGQQQIELIYSSFVDNLKKTGLPAKYAVQDAPVSSQAIAADFVLDPLVATVLERLRFPQLCKAKRQHDAFSLT